MTMTPTIQRGSSVLETLRKLIPLRSSITFTEGLRIAEIQAARFLALLDIDEFPVPDEAIAGLPRIQIEYVPELPAFGLSFWNGASWIIQLSTRQSRARQRFTLFHEYKHVVDHGHRDLLYRGDRRKTARVQAELAADYFAGCVLIPRRALKRAWAELRIQQPAARPNRTHRTDAALPASRQRFVAAAG
jgi:Zn-dependent peptidase ImmA (M78 family)